MINYTIRPLYNYQKLFYYIQKHIGKVKYYGEVGCPFWGMLEIANKNGLKCETAKNFQEAIRKISNKKEKIIVVFGSLYLAGNILSLN